MKKILTLALVIVMIMVAITGCGGGESPKPSTPASSGPAATGETSTKPESYKIAVVTVLTGNMAELGKNVEGGAYLAMKHINDAGGINGVPLVLESIDSKADPKESVDIAQNLVQRDDILAVLGDFSSSSCMAAGPIYEEGGLIQLSSSATHPDYAAIGDYNFGIMGRQDAEAPFYAGVIMGKYMGAKKVGMLYLNNDYGVSVMENMKTTFESMGIDLVAAEAFAEDATDFSAALSKIRKEDPDAFFSVSLGYQQGGTIVHQIRQMDWDVGICQSGAGYNEQYLDLVGENGEGVYGGVLFQLDPDTNPEDKETYDEFSEAVGMQPGTHAFVSYDGIMMLAKAIENAEAKGEVTRKTIRDELHGLKGFVGITGPIEFTPEGDVNRKYRICQIVDGQWVMLTDYDYY